MNSESKANQRASVGASSSIGAIPTRIQNPKEFLKYMAMFRQNLQ